MGTLSGTRSRIQPDSEGSEMTEEHNDTTTVKVSMRDIYQEVQRQGKLLEKILEKPLVLRPLMSKRYIIPESEKKGGSGAQFIVQWKSERPVNPPVVEAIMIGAKNQQGISFTSGGRVIQSSD